MTPVVSLCRNTSQTPVLALLSQSLLSTGRGDNFTINYSGFDQHGVDPAAFQAVFDRKAFRPVTNFSIPTHVHISFTLSANLEVDAHLQLMTSFLWLNMWYNPFLRWNPVECGGIRKLSMAAENLWLPDIFIEEFMDMAYVSSDDHIEYSKPMQVTSICNLDIFYFPFDEQNCTLTSSSFLYTERVWEEEDRKLGTGEWVLQGIHQRMMKMTVGTNEYDQIIFYVSSGPLVPRVISLLVPSSFLIAIDVLSFYLLAESESYAPFKMTLLLGYNVFLLMTLNDLLPASGTPSHQYGVYFALCLSLMVLRLLETIFITDLLHLATTQPPPRPRWLRSLLLPCTSPRKRCPAAPQKGNTGLGLSPAHLLCLSAGVKEPVELVGKVPGPREAELNGCPGSARAQQEDEAQKQHLVSLWLQLSHMTDTLLFRLCLLFPAPSVVTVIILWDT
uniref:Neurotransmitter-gated ion-channel ligand-binding domain-containing protein n=1 Tax=Balaenoptera musculus TaxID=9771 RepID=A0A8C0CQW0_BALMU